MSYKATIEIMGKKYTGSGKSVREALTALPYKGFPRLKSTLTVGDKTVVLQANQTMRLFMPNPLAKEIGVKQIAAKFE